MARVLAFLVPFVLFGVTFAFIIYYLFSLKAPRGKFNEKIARSARPFWLLLLSFIMLAMPSFLVSDPPAFVRSLTPASVAWLYLTNSLLAIFSVFIFRVFLKIRPIKNRAR